ncbi:MAG: hypothetical protein RIT45_1510 [Pseudomonadota bacterium]|jgi:predicted Zn-dependent protease with MMP-like domain
MSLHRWCSRRGSASGVLALLVPLLLAGPAAAFTILTTGSGQPKLWHKSKLVYQTIYDKAAPEPAASEGAELGGRIDVAMAPWSDVECDKDGTKRPIGVSFEMSGPAIAASCPSSDTMMGCAGGHGVVRVVAEEKDWTVSDFTVGYTVLASKGDTGENIRFVLYINDGTYDFCDTSCDGTNFDIRTVVLHEAGHVLGLDHSSLSSAVMADGRTPGEILRTPQDDDIAGICSLYPIDRGDDDGGGLCSAGRSGAPTPLFALLALAAGTLLLVRGRRRQLWLLGACVVVALPTSARAFTLATSPSGAHQRWSSATIAWDIDETGLTAQGVDKASTEAALQAAFSTWEAVQCGLCHDPNGVSCEPVACAEHALGLQFVFDGWKPPRAPGLGCAVQWEGSACSGTPDGNQVLFVYDQAQWPVASHVIALTLVAADNKSGLIGDADILVNTAHKTFCVAPDCAIGRYDLQNTVTHEVGHLLGLDHSLVSEATMFGGAPPQETSKRDLDPDDVAGVCTAYRMIWTEAGCPPATTEECCTAAPGTSSGTARTAGASAVALVAVAALAIGLQRRLG